MRGKLTRVATKQQMRLPVQQNKCPVRQICAIGLVLDLLSVAGHAGLVHQSIHLKMPHLAMGLGPSGFESPIGVRAAIGAWAMTRGKSHGFIQEEQRSPGTRRHGAVIATLGVRQIADDPVLVFPLRGAKPPVGERKDAAISGEHPTRALRHDLARWQNAVLQGRGAWRAHGLHHHFLGGGQFQVRIITFNTVDIPLKTRQKHWVAVIIMRDVLFVGIHQLFDLVLFADNPSGRGEL